jgi:hypothetical protein
VFFVEPELSNKRFLMEILEFCLRGALPTRGKKRSFHAACGEQSLTFDIVYGLRRKSVPPGTGSEPALSRCPSELTGSDNDENGT